MRNHLIKKLLLAAAITALATLAGTAMAEDEQSTLQALTDPSFVPFEMYDEETETMVGFDMDILAAVAERAGFDYNLKTMDFSGIIPALQTGTADVAIAGTTITEQRAKVVDFTDPYYHSGLRIMVQADTDDIDSMEDLKGKTVSTKIGSTSYEYLTEHFGDEVELKIFPHTTDMYQAVMNGIADAALYDAPNAEYFVKMKGGDSVKMVGPLYEAQPYGIVFTKASKWVEPANEALAEIKEDGTYAEI